MTVRLICGYGLAIISTLCTAYWLWELVAPSYGVLVAVIAAIAVALLEVAKFDFSSDPNSNSWEVMIVVVLFVVSVWCSWSLLDTSYRSVAGTQCNGECASDLIKEQYDERLSVASDYREIGYLTKSAEAQREAELIYDKYVAAQRVEQERLTSPLMDKLGWLFFLIVSVLIDLVGITCLYSSKPQTKVKQEQEPDEESHYETDCSDFELKESLTSEEMVRTAIENGEITNNVTSIMRYLRVGHAKAKSIYKKLQYP